MIEKEDFRFNINFSVTNYQDIRDFPLIGVGHADAIPEIGKCLAIYILGTERGEKRNELMVLPKVLEITKTRYVMGTAYYDILLENDARVRIKYVRNGDYSA